MEQVTFENLESFIERYAEARGGELNELTNSEAMFVFKSQFGGMYILNTGLGIVWIGIQNASARWSNNGKYFSSIRDALYDVLSSNDPIHSIDAGLFYSEDAASRLRMLANQNLEYKKSNEFLVQLKKDICR